MTDTFTALYVRLSEVTTASASIASQIADGRAECRKRDLGEPVVYEDEGKTASDAKRKRPAFERLMADVEAGKVTAIVCRDDDRLVRQPMELERVMLILEPRGIPVYFTAGSDLNLATPDGRAMARIRGAMARAEVEKKSARQKSANRHRAAEGQAYGTVRAFGYRREDESLVVVEKEAEAIRWAVDQVLKGATVASIAREWNSRGLKTAKYKTDFGFDAVKYVLLNPYICGHRAYQPSSILTPGSKRVPNWQAELIPGNWEPIISRDKWDALVQVLTHTRSKAGNRVKFLGGGLYLCGVCDDGTTLRTAYHIAGKPESRAYRCNRFTHVYLTAAPIDTWVEDCLKRKLRGSRKTFEAVFGASAPPVDTEALRLKRQQLVDKQEEAAESFSRGHIKLNQLELINRNLDAQIAKIDSQLGSELAAAETLQRFTDPGTILSTWEAASIEVKRHALRVIFPKILVYPTGGYREHESIVTGEVKKVRPKPREYVKIVDFTGEPYTGADGMLTLGQSFRQVADEANSAPM